MSSHCNVWIKTEEGASLPAYGSIDAAGADVRAYLKEDVILSPGSSARIPTGIYFEIPQGFEIQVRPRSGLAANHQITVLNTPGTIDADYRGELQIILINHGKESFIVTNGMRIAQIVLSPVVQAIFAFKEQLAETVRGTGGFGHTGLN
ncbi:dUTP diphosphatase [Parachlamydia acanthamoebae]|jgi:dUTP pyrophosphatase|uniref:Deoxyuridine 5'-triphosphate nucleotidohydrolase n=1 Tax=Parachlamydia acanthamoebae TaxID=83552 RepID=A0A0C1EHL5_9BACT|nr:dUTP diphosphatase [Parachlamydia acanthamoebae]KIA76099.1 Deoxyuridine 5'-triphosphate nucleotidohydrolase [Parachlamydia acanthamoebae]